MTKIKKIIENIYHNTILAHPRSTLIGLGVFIIFTMLFIPQFKLDASAESLVLENDQALQIYRKMIERYGSDDFLVVTFEPNQDLTDPKSLQQLTALRDELANIEGVASVTSILDIPIITSDAEIDITDHTYPTISAGNIDPTKALEAIRKSPLYRELLLSLDGKTTAIQVNLPRDEIYFSLLKQRNALLEKKQNEKLSSAEKTQLKNIQVQFREHLTDVQTSQSLLIKNVRNSLDHYRDNATLYLGGVPMIANDMIDYVRSDLLVFGISVTLLLMLMLAVFFGQLRWVLLPISCCLLSSVIMMGLLGLLDWRVTVISSNFISLLLIMTLSIAIHLVVRYRELQALHPAQHQDWLVSLTMTKMVKPIFYTTITTIVAFGSLIVSDIRPVIDFGMMMVVGLVVAFLVSFTFLPSVLLLLPKGKTPILENRTQAITSAFASFAQYRSPVILVLSSILLITSILGISRLTVDNRFIDYFKKHTEIFQGMQLIDKKLGGTTPLDIIIDADQDNLKQNEFDDFSQDGGVARYWLTRSQIDNIEKIQSYLEKQPEIGKVISLATAINVVESIPAYASMSDLELAMIPDALAKDIRKILIDPYHDVENEQIRFNVRLIESNPDLKRSAFFKKIQGFLSNEMQMSPDRIQLTGMAVLYNNMLQSLFQSQIMTIGAVFLAIMIMFMILFRSLIISIIAIIPNLLAATSVLGFMGLINLPLDMMTITIAAITIGIAVDDTIHYIHRFRDEFPKIKHYWKTVKYCHIHIGRAMYYTSIVVVAGFSILVLSNFNPTVYFGLLTSLAMIVALLGALTLLPLLIVLIKPFGKV